jgi:alkylation response protein AidB-like acyl-CoA dehydrogenase
LELTDKERAIVEDAARLVRVRIAPNAAEVDEAEDFPVKSYEAFREYGLLKLALPAEYGGAEADATVLSLIISEISKACPSSALMVFPTQAVIRTVMTVGNPEQRERFGRIFSPGDKLAAFCLSEPNFGSDAGSLQCRADRDGDDYVLNGSKAWVTLGGVADWYMTFVRIGPGARTKGISLIMVPKDTPGLSFGRKEIKMGLRGSVTAQMHLLNARVSKENLLSGEGQGWKILSETCNHMRAWGAASMALGLAEGAFDQALAYAKKRIQFKRSLARIQAVQFMLADMKIKIEAVRSLIRRTTRLMDRKGPKDRDLDMLVSACKCLAADTAMEVTENAVQVLGAEGVRPRLRRSVRGSFPSALKRSL